MEQSGKERRRKPRFNAELSCDVTPGGAQLLFPDERLECRTRDLSETGVGVVADSIYVGYTCVVDEGRALHVRLALPAGRDRGGGYRRALHPPRLRRARCPTTSSASASPRCPKRTEISTTTILTS